ncbi:MAG: hypothetical protein ACRCTZ_03240 [Sarcina sp.]
MERKLNNNTKCLKFDVITKNIKEKNFLIEICIKNNNKFDIFDVTLISNIPACFEYINKTLCIDDIPFYDFTGINKLNIDNLYINEEIKISYELKCKKEINFNYIDIELIYKDKNNEIYSEIKNKVIEEILFYEKFKKEPKKLKVIKKANTNTAIVSEIIEYEIIVENIGNEILNNIEVVDIQKKEIEILGDYIYLNNKKIDICVLSKGVYVKSLEINQKICIKFKVKIIEKPHDSEVYNKIRISYEYAFKGINMICTEEFESDRVKIYNMNFEIKKKVNKKAVSFRDELEFRVDIKNSGDVNCYNVNIYEVLSDEVEFIIGSFYNEKENINIYSLEKGINIGNLLKGEEVTLYYSVIVKKICSTGYINSQISADFKYKCDVKSPIKYLNITKKEFKIEAINPGFTEFEIGNIIDMKNDLIELVDITQSIKIDDNYVVKTAIGKAVDGRVMNQYKVVVLGCLNVCIEYAKNRECEDIYIYKDKKIFIEEIVLAHDYKVGAGINIKAISNNIYFKKITGGKILYKNSNLVEAIVKDF